LKPAAVSAPPSRLPTSPIPTTKTRAALVLMAS
jgi:hypothetical protein